jgi:hypothetical protein
MLALGDHGGRWTRVCGGGTSRDVSAETANLNCGGISRHCCQKGAAHSHRLLAEPRRRLVVARLGEEGGLVAGSITDTVTTATASSV